VPVSRFVTCSKTPMKKNMHNPDVYFIILCWYYFHNSWQFNMNPEDLAKSQILHFRLPGLSFSAIFLSCKTNARA